MVHPGNRLRSYKTRWSKHLTIRLFIKITKSTPAMKHSHSPDEMEKLVKEMPRDAEIVELFKKLNAAGPLPAR